MQTMMAQKRLILPMGLSLSLVLAAFLGALVTGTEVGVVTGGVENLSASSNNLLDNANLLNKSDAFLPLAFAFGAGMAAAVNPCGFAMLPAYLGLYLGSGDEAAHQATTVARVRRGLLIGSVVTAGFVLLFGVTGIVIGAGAQSVARIFPWIGLGIGIVLAFGGAWVLSGRTFYSSAVERLSAHSGDPRTQGVRGYFAFGLGYGIASLSCALPIFIIVIGTSFTASTFLQSAGQFLMYALGMGFVIMALTLGVAIFRGALVGKVRRVFPYIQPISAVFLIVAGAYIVYYWLTIGGLVESLR